MTFRAPVIQNDLFEGIMSKNEFLEYQAELSLEDRADIVLISISEPDNSEYVSDNKSTIVGFHDVLEMKFWDLEEEFRSYKPLTDEQGTKIRNFIKKNKDKKFLIHCKAGQSRSAGVGLAVECIVKFNGSRNDYDINKSNICNYTRYSPNLTVFCAICKDDEHKYCEDI